MGGDHAPKVNVKGAVLVAEERSDIHIVLVGDEARLRPLLTAELKKSRNSHSEAISIQHTAEYIEMDDHPAQAVRQKKEASLNVAMRLAAENEHSAFLSAGNSGAALASAIMYMKRIEGVERPAIAAPLPSTRGILLLLDAGANTQCKPSHLIQWALLGSGYYRAIFPGSKGTVGVLSNGAEDTKGTDLTRATNAHLRELQDKNIFPPETYRGYVEGARLFHGNVDVVVCDGFTGNLVLKSLEGLTTAVSDILKKEVKKDWLAIIGAFLLGRVVRNLKKRTDYAEVGSAPLIGVNGHAFIAHGRSNPRAIKNGILRAAESAKTDLPNVLRKIIAEAEIAVSTEKKDEE
jgi:glycerol-3-phosphate acyltransferase PlsX